MKKILIIGIDPGTTLGYAILDLNGNAIEINSSKELNIDKLMRLVYQFGKPILVGCDKHKVPSFVERFAMKIGATVDWPEKDLSTEEKKKLVKGFDYKNTHEKDAIACAVFAYNNVKDLFRRIDWFLEKENKIEFADKVKEIMIKNPELNIPAALEKLAPPKKEIKKEKIILEKKIEHKDYLKLKEKYDKLLAEKNLILKQNKELKNKIDELESKMKSTKKIIVLDKKIKKKIDLKDMNLINLFKKIKQKEHKIKEQDNEIAKLNNFLSKLNDHVLLKKLSNLGLEEFNSKNRILNIGEDDVLLVDDCSVFSEKILERLKNNLNIIVYKGKISKKIKHELNCLDAKQFKIQESGYYAIINEKEFEKQLKKRDLLGRIVEEYREGK